MTTTHFGRFGINMATLLVGSAVLAIAHQYLGVPVTEPMQSPGGWLLGAQVAAGTTWQVFGA
jgi:hypothetical protein